LAKSWFISAALKCWPRTEIIWLTTLAEFPAPNQKQLTSKPVANLRFIE
jgi:hypothetical protein